MSISNTAGTPTRRQTPNSLNRPQRSRGRLTEHGTGSEVRSFRASPAEWAEWRRLADAAGLPLNRWLRRAVNDAEQLERTLAQMHARENDRAAGK
jgi:hypothetical protein